MTKKEKRTIGKICKKIRPKFIKRFGTDLCGGCWNISDKLHRELFKIGIITKLIQGYIKGGRMKHCGGFHYWLEYKGNIIDLTATQFNLPDKYYPKILIKPISRLREYVSEEIV